MWHCSCVGHCQYVCKHRRKFPIQLHIAGHLQPPMWWVSKYCCTAQRRLVAGECLHEAGVSSSSPSSAHPAGANLDLPLDLLCTNTNNWVAVHHTWTFTAWWVCSPTYRRMILFNCRKDSIWGLKSQQKARFELKNLPTMPNISAWLKLGHKRLLLDLWKTSKRLAAFRCLSITFTGSGFAHALENLWELCPESWWLHHVRLPCLGNLSYASVTC